MASGYRDSGPNPPRDLVRLSREGAALAAREADRQVRIALGENFGAPSRTLGYALMGAGLLTFATIGVLDSAAWREALLFVAPGLTIVGAAIPLFSPPLASDATLAHERRWLASQPFPVAGYFEILGQKPATAATVRMRVRFVAEPPALELVQGLLGRVHSAGAAEPVPERALLLRSAQLDGESHLKRRTFNNHRIVPHVHAMLDDVLLRLHRSYPIAGVELERDD